MIKRTLLLMFLTMLSCQSAVTEQSLPQLNGYWEIKTVVFPDGTTKKYETNMTVDYFEVNELKGFRKKMQAQLNGTFSTSNDAESFTIIKADEGFFMHYKNNLSEWQESILSLDDTSLSLINQEGVRYDYRRFETPDFELGE